MDFCFLTDFVGDTCDSMTGIRTLGPSSWAPLEGSNSGEISSKDWTLGFSFAI